MCKAYISKDDVYEGKCCFNFIFFVIIIGTAATFRGLDTMHCTMLNYNTSTYNINKILTKNVLTAQ